AIRVPDVEAGLDRETSGVNEVGVGLTRGDQNDRFGLPTLRRLRPGARSLGTSSSAASSEPGAADCLRDRLEQLQLLFICALRRPRGGAALEVQLLLDLVAARVCDLVAQLAELL